MKGDRGQLCTLDSSLRRRSSIEENIMLASLTPPRCAVNRVKSTEYRVDPNDRDRGQLCTLDSSLRRRSSIEENIILASLPPPRCAVNRVKSTEYADLRSRRIRFTRG